MPTPLSRPYTPGRGRWWTLVYEAGALVYLHWSTTRLFHIDSPHTWLLAVVLLLVWTAGAWRILRLGLYVGDAGLVVRHLFTTRTVAWPEIDTITLEPVVHRLASFSIPAGRCVFIRLKTGRAVNTSLWEKGVDFHSRPELLRRVLDDLRERLRASSPG